MRAIWQGGNPEHWSFWLRWWDGVLSGKQLPWDLQEKVALIPNEIWQQGAEAVSARIALIQEKFRLRSEVAELRAELGLIREQAASVPHRGHNNPPELLEPSAAIRREITIVWEALVEAEEELGKDEPEPSRLRRIGLAILAGTRSFALYCVDLGDIALKKSAEELGTTGTKWLVGGGFLLLASRMDGVRSFAEALIKFAGTSAGGG